MSLRRRQLISFGFLRERTPPKEPRRTDPPPPQGFSLERFYRDRAEGGTRDEPLPSFVIRVVPEDFEVTDD